MSEWFVGIANNIYFCVEGYRKGLNSNSRWYAGELKNKEMDYLRG
jgi:hypothetical protein